MTGKLGSKGKGLEKGVSEALGWGSCLRLLLHRKMGGSALGRTR
jgi:hypothetical protein